MAGTKTLLFLFGITIVSSHVLRNAKPCKHGHIHEGLPIVLAPSPLADETPILPPMTFTASDFPSYMSPFVQQGTNLFYKPQFMVPGMAIPSPITTVIQNKPDCKHKPAEVVPVPLEEIVDIRPTLIVPEPPKLNEETVIKPVELPKPVVIPPPPALPPMPELPTPVVVEVVPEILPEHAVAPAVPEYKPISIPEPPALPPFVMPELPPVVIPVAPEFSPIAEVPIPEYQPLAIPEPPVLPPFTMPELTQVLIPVAPPCDHIPEYKPLVIPEPPVLHPFTMPELSPVVVPSFDPIPELKPVVIPEPPVLPPFTMPEIPADIAIPTVPELPIVEVPQAISEWNEPASELTPMHIPEAPRLPPMAIPEIPTTVDVAPPFLPTDPILPEYKPVEIPAPPQLPPFEMPVLPEVVVPEVFQGPVVISEIPAIPEITENKLTIPEAPKLPPFVLPELPSIETIELVPNQEIVPNPVFPLIDIRIPEIKALEIPQAPVLAPLPIAVIPEKEEPCLEDETPAVKVLPSLRIPELPIVTSSGQAVMPTFMAQNIIIERVLPNLILDCDKNLSLADVKYPVFSKGIYLQR